MPHNRIYWNIYESPVGPLLVQVNLAGELLKLEWQATQAQIAMQGMDMEHSKYACGEVEYQLQQYFSGERESFSIKAKPSGSPFRQQVWQRVRRIPYGEQISYGELARKIGNRQAARAVAAAVADNPISIVIPCHRVVPKSGGPGNYALRSLPDGSGKKIKLHLLSHEVMHKAN